MFGLPLTDLPSASLLVPVSFGLSLQGISACRLKSGAPKVVYISDDGAILEIIPATYE